MTRKELLNGLAMAKQERRSADISESVRSTMDLSELQNLSARLHEMAVTAGVTISVSSTGTHPHKDFRTVVARVVDQRGVCVWSKTIK